MASRFVVRRVVQVALIAGGLLPASLQSPALATHPGTNGKIAFWQFNNGHIKAIEPDGSERSLISGGPDASGPAWSPDGSQIAYASRSGPDSLIVANADGTNPTVIVGPDDGIGWLVSPSWSSDGTQIAVLSHLKGTQGGRVTIVTLSDGSLLQIGSDEALSYDALDWSPSGTIAYLTGYESRLRMIQPDGSGREILGGRYLFDPSWSPNGSRLAVAHYVGARTDIITMKADGSRRRQLTASPERWEWTPAWSPDGTMIAFSRTQTSDDQAFDDVWVMGADGSDPHRITDTVRQDEFALDWQPIP